MAVADNNVDSATVSPRTKSNAGNHNNIDYNDSLVRWLVISTKDGYGLFSKDVWTSNELLPILEKYVEYE